MTRTELLATAKPILFNTEMVRAILEDKKTATRRVVKTARDVVYKYARGAGMWKATHTDVTEELIEWFVKERANPPCQIGDILYVRETWYYESHMYEPSEGDALYCYVYRADQPDYPVNVGVGEYGWKPSIHMPKEAARLFLRVTDVRVERLQDITFEQIENEGITPYDFVSKVNRETAKKQGLRLNMMRTWNSTIKKADIDRCGWNSNPWVWVIEFERVNADVH